MHINGIKKCLLHYLTISNPCQCSISLNYPHFFIRTIYLTFGLTILKSILVLVLSSRTQLYVWCIGCTENYLSDTCGLRVQASDALVFFVLFQTLCVYLFHYIQRRQTFAITF